MKINYFINKWADKVVKEYDDKGMLEVLIGDSFLISFEQYDKMLDDLKKVQLPLKHKQLDYEGRKELLTDKLQDKVELILEDY